MNFIEAKDYKNVMEHTRSRLEMLFDAIIAIAMTMMALDITIPLTNAFNLTVLRLLFKEITVYLISFIALASIWGIHCTLCSFMTVSENISFLIINVLLMFVITIFPVLTKLMASFRKDILLAAVYLGCYTLMEILLLIFSLLVSRQTVQKRAAQLEKILDIIKIQQSIAPEKREELTEVERKLELAEKYLFDRKISERLLGEIMLKLPEQFQERQRRYKIERLIQNYRAVSFGVITFLVVFLSVTVLIVNPFWCYIIILTGAISYLIVCFLVKAHFQRKEIVLWD